MAKRFFGLIFLFLPLVFSLAFFGIFLYQLTVYAADVTVNATVPSLCGNGFLDGTEVCDDGNTVSCDGCISDCSRADNICGDSITECSEGCESNSQCSSAICRSNCTCELIIGCTPGNCNNVLWSGLCVNNVEEGTGSNGCESCTVVRACGLPICGNNIVETGEECDDGNTTSNDGCSLTCQLEIGCGNGTVDAAEECDDGNIVSGDCCSSICQKELIISNITETAGTNNATISWQTLCQVTVSNLEWGMTVAVSDGSASGITGNSLSHQITGLNQATVYYYRITSTANSLTAVETGSFQTLGSAENCNNGVDDDSDGYCDYLASNCTDSSIPGDLDCSCSSNFSCNNGACQPNNTWTVTCVDQTVPKCEPDYSYTQTCNTCQGVTCDQCQTLNTQTCTCQNNANCCGNNICEVDEDLVCPADCPEVVCVSEWDCEPWAPDLCPSSGIQTRNCYDKNACQIPTNPQQTSQSCGPQCQGLTCGTCQKINIDQCLCEEMVPCCGNGRCETGENNIGCSQDCIEPCTPSWSCGGWSACSQSQQTRQCSDSNNCGLNLNRPPEVRSCGESCDIACNLCQRLSVESCACLNISPCCGNGICDESESVSDCAVDCGLPPHQLMTMPQCLDGLDNDNDGLADYPADQGCSNALDNSELNVAEVIQKVENFIKEDVWENEVVQEVNKQLAAPALITAVAVNTVASFSLLNFASYLRYFFSQPLAVLFRRRRKKWGVVYNSLTKQPIDLAIVRLYQKDTGRLVQSRVTDKEGRFVFLAEAGFYFMTVTKPKFVFPTTFLKEQKEDVKFLDLYHGEAVEVTGEKATIAVNIPVDPTEETRPIKSIITKYYLRKIQYAAAFLAVPLALLTVLISPSLLTVALLCFHFLLYFLFRRLGYQRPPKNWGIIYDKENKKPLGLAITRIYDKKFNKLLETRVSDSKGRYSFLVNNNTYYVTVEKNGYHSHQTDDIDLIEKDREALVDIDIALNKQLKAQGLPPSEITPTPNVPTATPLSQKPSAGVGQESLAEVMQQKNVDQNYWQPEPISEVPKAQPSAGESPAVTPDPALEKKVLDSDKEKGIFG